MNTYSEYIPAAGLSAAIATATNWVDIRGNGNFYHCYWLGKWVEI